MCRVICASFILSHPCLLMSSGQSVVLSLAPVMIWGPLGGHRDTMHMTAAANLAQARREAREFGEERRREIRKRVQEYREKCDMMNEKHTRRRGEDLDS